MSINYIDVILSTRPQNKHRRSSAQSLRDHERIQRRVQSNGILTDYISAYLEKYFRKRFTSASLLSIAKEIINKEHLNIDRLAKRNRTALLCWFAENWNKIYPFLESMNNDKLYDEKNSESESSKDKYDDSLILEYDYGLNALNVSSLLNSH